MRARKKREVVKINEVPFVILRCFGERKDGNQYLVTNGKEHFVMKEYFRADVFEKVRKDYGILLQAGIRMPKLFMVDEGQSILIKQYLEGETADVVMRKGNLLATYLDQLRNMAGIAEEAGYSLDYFPTHYVCSEQKLYYIHYEAFGKTESNRLDQCLNKYWLRPIEIEL